MKRWRRTGLAAVAVIVFAACLPTTDTRWFGWVTENRAQHRVCGEGHQHTQSGGGLPVPVVAGESRTWFQGWGTSNPGCLRTIGDYVPGGWLGAKVWVFRNGALCGANGWRYNVGYATRQDVTSFGCENYLANQQYQTYHEHQWWAYDSNAYAQASAWTPIGEG